MRIKVRKGLSARRMWQGRAEVVDKGEEREERRAKKEDWEREKRQKREREGEMNVYAVD